MSNVVIKSDKFVKFAIQDTQMLISAESKAIVLQAGIINQEGYDHPLYANSAKTSEELQAEQTKADFRALAKAVFFVGAFVPFPPVKIICSVGMVGMDLYEAKEAAERGNESERNWNYLMAAADIIPMMGIGAKLMRTTRLAGAIGKVDTASKMVAHKSAAITRLINFKTGGKILKVPQGARAFGTQGVKYGKNLLAGLDKTHPMLMKGVRTGRKYAVGAGKGSLKIWNSRPAAAARVGATGVLDYKYNDRRYRQRQREEAKKALENSSKIDPEKNK
ncbi:hypothetical protein SAMN02910356_00332 [Selenomonas sp. GACV-9]|uniref:hypothetical protein n=1 Tax=Selenomonas sp. GACV-9 TaxID=3158782 RepID=UPI0008F2F92F|nr:hypothetical protein SAMN02910356_00332 [Selenomonas ruminantium]